MFAIWHTVPVNTIEDARTHELVVGASGSNSSPAFFSRVFQAVFDVKIKLLAGYAGASEALLAMERGENDGNLSAYWSSLKAIRPDWIAEKKIKFLLQYGAHPHPELKGVPYALDLIKDAKKREKLKERIETHELDAGVGKDLFGGHGLKRPRHDCFGVRIAIVARIAQQLIAFS